jgi:cobalt-zinc-cadmium efflux system membrane fusion protein
MIVPLRCPSASGRRKWRSTSIRIAAAGILATGSVLLAGCGKGVDHAAQATDQPLPGAAFRPTEEQWRGLTVGAVGTASFQEEERTDGQIAVDDDITTPVLAPFSGQVDKVMVQAGDHVVRGQPLAAVRATEIAQGEADLGAAAANLASARIQLRAAEANDARQKALLAAEGAAERDVQQAESDLAAARSAVAADEAAATAARNRLQILGYDPARPPVGALALIRSPIAGVVIQRQVGVGQYLNSAANGATTPLFTVGDLSKVWLVANVREEDAGRMRVGEPVRARLIALPGRTFEARISYVAPALDPATHRLPVRAVLDNPGGVLKPGMFADFTIVSGAGRTAPAAPASAVLYDGPRARVWVVQPDRSLALQPIEVGGSQGDWVEVIRGLAPGQKVVSSGALFIDRAAKGD